MSDEILLRLSGTAFGGWTEISVRRSIERAAGSFTFKATEFDRALNYRRRIRKWEPCEILVAGEVVISGYVFAVEPQYDAENHSVTINGRSRVGNLVDCSAAWKTGEWRNRTLTQIARDIARPFGISVVEDADVGRPFKKFRLQESEKAFAAIERMCRQRGVWATSSADGSLLLTDSGPHRPRVTTELVLGKNIKAGFATDSGTDRYSVVRVKGQRSADDFDFGDSVTSPFGESTDPEVPFYRNLILLAEAQGDGLTLAQRARWEVNHRAADGTRAVLTVPGWRHSAGLWEPNTIVPVRDSFLGIDDELLIAEVGFELGETGSISRLTLGRPEAFDRLAIPEKEQATGDTFA